MATQAIDERGFVIDPDHVARQRMIDERAKLFAMLRQGETLLAEYDRIIGQPGYPAANKAFDREYSGLARAAYGFWLLDELHDVGVAFDPDWCAEPTPIRAGLHSECR
jgi:hypothetical protein